jgi:bifunctional enzyme CysN/CysC
VSYEGDLQEAFPPMAVTVTLADEVDVSRGDTLVHPANLPRVDQAFEAMIVWMGDEPLLPGKPYLFKQTNNVVSGQVATLRYRVDVNTLHRETASALAMNEVGRCTVRLNRRICFDPYARNRSTGAFIVIDRLTNRTVGAGMIVDRATSLRFLEDHWEEAGAEDAPGVRVRASEVTLQERETRLGHPPATILLTGLSGSGKTAIAYALERRLFEQGSTVCVLDGSRMRRTISRDLGFSAGERSENLRRSVDIARILNDAGLICIAAFLAPDAAVREKARTVIGPERFFEVFLDAPVEVCRQRDVDGMYRKADLGEISDLPGATAPYERPTAPDLTLHTDRLSVDECVERLVDLLQRRGVIR